MITCEQCRFWNLESPLRTSGMGDCMGIPEGDFFRYSDENQLAYTSDHEDYMSVLVTKPNFGCVLGEKKET